MPERSKLLNESELFRSLLEASFDAFWLSDEQGRFLDVNKSFTELLGYNRDEILKMTVFDIEAKETAEETVEHLRRIKEKRFDYFETRHRCKDGKVIEIQASANYSPVDGGIIFGFLHNITRRKHNENMIRLSEERFRLIAEAASTLVFEVEVPAQTVVVPVGLKKFFGYEPDELTFSNQLLINQVHPDDRAKVQKAFADSLGTMCCDKLILEFRVRHKNGHYVNVRNTAKIVKNQQGKATRIVGGLVNITQEKKAEEELRENEEKYRHLVEYAPTGICEIDLNKNKIKTVNEAMCTILGYSQEELLTLEPLNLVAKSSRGQFRDAIKRSLAGDEIEKAVECLAKAKKRRRIWTNIHLKPIYKKGKLASVLVIAHDITRRKEEEAKVEEYLRNLENIIQERTQQLQDAERLATIGQTAGMVGHDIRNPLQAIVSELYLQTSELKNLPHSETKAAIQESVDSIQEQVFYINKIVSDLQDYARPLTPNLETVELDKIVKDILSTVKVPENIRISYSIEPTCSTLTSDYSFIKRILSNLTTNAIQAMPNGGTLSITAVPKDQKVVISVVDTGQGIPQENIDRLFKPLFTTKSKGQGFGLAVVKRLTQKLGGTITFESKVGKGTRFTLEFPLQDNQS